MSGPLSTVTEIDDADAAIAIEFIEDAVAACQGKCPDCNGELDTGWQCDCGGDFRDVVMALNDDAWMILSVGA